MKQLLIGGFLGSLILVAAMLPVQHEAKAFHSKEELMAMRHLMVVEPVDSSILFPTASVCSGCHGFDSNYFAMVDFFGNDVNIHDDWQATMMANSAKDPFWRAKVSHEITLIPDYSEEIQDKCVSCHAPMGHYTAFYRGHGYYTIDDLLQDSIGLDGVSCSACHMISPENLGKTFSGEIHYDTSRVMYGPYEEPFSGPMTDFVGFEPVYSPHVGDAGMCASCHTLVTSAFTLDGQPTGETFIEQATYHEWLNSVYAEDQLNITCQACHMPQLEEDIVISSGYAFLDGRSPYGLHEMAGANTFMLELMKTYREELDIDALPEHFDETIQATYRMLQFQSLNTELEWLGMDADTAVFRMELENKAGHKFPSGYPARRLFVQFLVETAEGDTLFHSGEWNPDYTLVHEDPTYEPHYDVIRAEDQVQIYEMVAGDGTNEFTVVLEHARFMTKDNRLPPRGFSADHPVADTTLIVGGAAIDENFNWNEEGEGSGADELFFHIATQGYVGPVVVKAKAYYHALPPKWVNPILEFSTPAIDTFEAMFNSMDNLPVLIATEELTDVAFPEIVSTTEQGVPGATLFPNPTGDRHLYFRLPPDVVIEQVTAYSVVGQEVQRWNGPLRELVMPAAGVFWLEITTNRGRWVEKVTVW